MEEWAELVGHVCEKGDGLRGFRPEEIFQFLIDLVILNIQLIHFGFRK